MLLSATSPDGCYKLRLTTQPLHHTSLPAHLSLPDATDGKPHPPLNSFLYAAISAGTGLKAYLDRPTMLFTSQGQKSSAPSTALVELFSSGKPNNKPGKDGSKTDEEDHWFARRSVHADKAERGTASWDEFVHGLRDEHVKHEKEYTPSVSSVEEVLKWDEVKGMEVMMKDSSWRIEEACVNAITHTFPFPVSPRTFIVLQMTATQLLPTQSAFITVQLPLSLPHSVLAPSVSNKPGILAHYTSVEHVRRLPSNSSPLGKAGDIEWIMATSSDAGGSIPQWVERSWVLGGVPKAIVKDVGLFLGWVDNKRGKK